MQEKIVSFLKNFNELVAFKHTVFSIPFIFIAMITAADGWFGFKLLILGLLAAISARNFAMALNRYTDREFDSKNPRTLDRPSVDGRVNESELLFFITINALAFVLVSYMINSVAFALSFPFLAILGFYSFVKRFSPMAHLFLGVALGLAPIAGVVAVSETVTIWSLLLSIGVLFWVAGFDLLYALQDIDFDKEAGLYSIPSKYGEQCTLFISKLFHALTVVFWLFFAFASETSGNLVVFAVFLSAIMLGYEHYIVSKDHKNIDRAFFTVNGYLGIMFLVFVILDKVL